VYRTAYGPMSTPRRDAPRSIGTPINRMAVMLASCQIRPIEGKGDE
jgi:hypothetical protein